MEKSTAGVWSKLKDRLPVGAASFFGQTVSVGLAQKRAGAMARAAAMAAVEDVRGTRPPDPRRIWSVWS